MGAGIVAEERPGGRPEHADALTAYAALGNVPALAGVLCARLSAEEVDELIARLLTLRARAETVYRESKAGGL